MILCPHPVEIPDAKRIESNECHSSESVLAYLFPANLIEPQDYVENEFQGEERGDYINHIENQAGELVRRRHFERQNLIPLGGAQRYCSVFFQQEKGNSFCQPHP